MKCFIPDKNVRKLLARYPELEVTRTDHHVRVRHRLTRDFIIIAMTSSDWRSLRKVERDLEHLTRARVICNALPGGVLRSKCVKQGLNAALVMAQRARASSAFDKTFAMQTQTRHSRQRRASQWMFAAHNATVPSASPTRARATGLNSVMQIKL